MKVIYHLIKRFLVWDTLEAHLVKCIPHTRGNLGLILARVICPLTLYSVNVGKVKKATHTKITNKYTTY